MKTRIFTLLLAVAASVGTMFAEKVQIGDLYYNLDATSQTAEVAENRNVSGDIVIPSSVTYNSVSYSVTSIGDQAFCFCSGLTSVTIPNSVTSIGYYAFRGCSGLTSVTIPNSVTSIGILAFLECSSLTSPVYNAHIFACLPTSYSGAYTIPDGIESIAGYAFADCTGLTSVTIPNSVTSIGYAAFQGCTGFPVIDNIRYADTYLIEAVDKTLSTYTIKDGTKWIGTNAFSGCRSLTSVTIPNSVTSIGSSAFSGCSGLTSVTIGNSVTSIGSIAFSGCRSLISVTIPNSVTSIGIQAFYGCRSLISVTIPNSVTSIEFATFYDCSGLTSVTIPNSVTSIGSDAFRDCSGLTSVTIGNSVTSIISNAFSGCSGLTSIYVPCGTLDAYKNAEGWSNYASIIKYAPLPYKISTHAENGSVATTDVATLSICEPFVTCTATPDYGYHFTQWSDGLKDNPRIAQITQDTTFTAEFAPDRVGTCGKDLSLVWSYDPTNKVLTIGNAGSFTENMQFGAEAPNEMEELVIGNSVTAIGANAFAGISSLKKVSIGESVKTIGEQAFFNCVNLETIFNYRPTPTNTYSNAFDGVDKFECTLYVLPSSIDMYKAAAVWRDFYYTYAIGAEETTVITNDVTVEPQNNAVTVTWPTSENAASYTIQITKDGVVFCTLIFNANGQLTGIAFAPSREGQAHAPVATKTANGLQFTVTGLDSGTHYDLTLQAKDSQNAVLASYSSNFTTTGDAQGIEDVQGNNVPCTKIVRDGHIFILRGEKVYNAQGALVK